MTPSPTPPLVGQRIRQARTERGITQQQLADAAGLTTNGLYLIEVATTNRGQWDTILRIADALTRVTPDRPVSLDWLAGRDSNVC